MNPATAGVGAEVALDSWLHGDRRALAAAITEVERGTDEGGRVTASLRGRPRRAVVIGVTGPPGAGKSTLVGAVVDDLLARGRRVGVLLVDPSSPVTGGAVLADRVRMRHHVGNPDLYVRSVGSRGHQGGLSRAAGVVVGLLDAWGADVVLVETVGAGQGEVAVCGVADCTVVVSPPGLGDELQAMKAGQMELADVFVVNKADRPGAAETATMIEHVAAHAADGTFRPVLATVATTGEGVAALVDLLDARPSRPAKAHRPVKAALAAAAAAWIEEEIMRNDSTAVLEIIEAVMADTVDAETAARRLTAIVAGA